MSIKSQARYIKEEPPTTKYGSLANPYGGKNRAQRGRLGAVFCGFKVFANRGDTISRKRAREISFLRKLASMLPSPREQKRLIKIANTSETGGENE